MAERTCVVCGKSLAMRHLRAQVCSDNCHKARKNARRRRSLKERACVVCGGLFIGHVGALLCGEKCAVERRTEKQRARYHRTKAVYSESRECIICGAVFQARNGRQRTCGKECGHALERRTENARRRAKTASKAGQPASETRACIVCGGRFYRRGNFKTCSHKCAAERARMKDREYRAKNPGVRAERCRRWRTLNPDKQKASTRRWEESNRDHHLSRVRERSAKWRREHPEEKAAQGRKYRATSPRPAEYQAERTAAVRLVTLLETHGVAALSPDFSPPPLSPKKMAAREAARKWRERNPDYEPQRPLDERRESRRRRGRKEAAAMKMLRELETKGLEALI